MENTNSLLNEKYRPTELSDYVGNGSLKSTIAAQLYNNDIQNYLFYGPAGTGKTTLAKLIVNKLDCDYLYINASDERGIDTIRDKVSGFASVASFKPIKVVILDEADFLTIQAQASLRNIIETFSRTTRFILTCNYPNKVIPALHSRCQGFHIDKIDTTEFTARIATVLVTEGVEVDLDTLDSYVKATYPDLRKCINLVQMNTVDGKLVKPQESDNSTADYRLAVVDLFKQGKILEARKLLCTQVRPEEMDEVFRWMYDNLELWGTTQEQHDAAVLVIAKGLRNIPMVADQEINLAATLVELSQI